ncbi:MAG: cation:proton antiporter [Halobacteriota archaeon]
MSAELLPIVTVILALGIGAQIVAKRLQIPSVLFLIAIGVVLGPELLGVVTAETFGGGLSTIVGLSVAIIVFDGAFQLRREKLERAPKAITGLTTIGAIGTLFGTALAVRFFLDVPWGLSFLIGSLLIATGPTVITPILDVVKVREHVGITLEAEGIFNDVTAAVLAIVLFETVVLSSDPTLVPGGFLQRLAVGIGIGMAIAFGVRLVLTRLRMPADDAPQIARFVVLGGALLSYGLSESILPETGVAAAAAAGFVLGNLHVPHEESIDGFARDLTLIVLSFVFISLAALIDFGALIELGLAGLGVVVAVTLVVRPIAVFLSARDKQFSRNEQYFLSLVGPRGIIPASVATLFAIELQSTGRVAEAQTLIGVVFLLIFVTVLLQAGLSRQIAQKLDVIPMPTIIVGGGRVGRVLATRLENRGENIVIVDSGPETVERLQVDGFNAIEGDGTDAITLQDARIDRAKRVIAATGDDNTNLLVAQLAKTKFEVTDVLARVNDPENVDAFEALDVRAIDASTATAWSIDNEIERPAIAHWMNELGEGHDIQEVEVTADDLVGKTIREVNADIPDGCIVAVIGRDDETHVPSADEELLHGDHITFVGQSKSVAEAIRRFHPHD